MSAAELEGLGYSFPPWGEGCITQLGDYWLSITPQPTGPAVASLVLDEDELFTAEVQDLIALQVIHSRSVALIAEREAAAGREDDLELSDVGEQDY